MKFFFFFFVFLLQNFLYLIWYTTMSIFGHFNNFFFAAHLLDIAMGFKTLRTILSSVTHNGKQVSVSTSRGSQSARGKSSYKNTVTRKLMFMVFNCGIFVWCQIFWPVSHIKYNVNMLVIWEAYRKSSRCFLILSITPPSLNIHLYQTIWVIPAHHWTMRNSIKMT